MLKYVKSQRSYGFLITKELIFGFQILDLKDHFSASLKMTDIKLALITDVDMFQFIEKGMRGGVSYIANRYGKANNKYI